VRNHSHYVISIPINIRFCSAMATPNGIPMHGDVAAEHQFEEGNEAVRTTFRLDRQSTSHFSLQL